MKKKITYAALAALLPLAVLAHLALEDIYAPPALPDSPRRIVSLAPSITETLYALGLGDAVAGVTGFCAYPPEVKNKPVVAGFSDIDYEALLRLNPDLVILPEDKRLNRQDLERLGLAVMNVDSITLEGFIRDVERMGNSMGRQKEAGEILAGLRQSMALAAQRADGKKPPKVLFAVMHSYEGNGYITETYAIGRGGFYSELITAAGGKNAYEGELPFPRLSREALIFLDPDVIIDVIPNKQANIEGIMRDWQSLESVSAVKNGRIHLLTDEAHTVPGPRSYKTLDTLSKAFHPHDD